MSKVFSAQTWTGPAAFAVAVAWLVWLAVTSLWPTTYWFDVRAVHVHDSREGEPVLMTVDRMIAREFDGRYFVQVRVINADGGVGPVKCPGAGGGPYLVGSELPNPLTLDWWASTKCDLPAGRYRAVTTWEIKPDLPILPGKRLTVFSNVFEVLPNED